ncbi:MAG: hypothetical protein M1833_004449 [Piccolia ochrophora]|nr:MAG: hypothetical protein M1833_004449 [Piccolia ochrophora]
MSLESALDEERLEILKLISPPSEAPRSYRPSGSGGQASLAPNAGQRGRTDSPATGRSPVRSMLDISSDPPPPRHASIAGAGVGITNLGTRATQRHPTVRSMLDPTASPPPPPMRTSNSTNTSPTESPKGARPFHRTQSDASAYPPEDNQRPLRPTYKTTTDDSIYSPNADYQFDILPSPQAKPLPKRVTQGGKRSGKKPSSMASVLQSSDLGAPTTRGNDRGRHSIAATGLRSSTKSQSPSTSRFGRSQSPHHKILNTNSFNLMPNPGQYLSDEGKVVDLNTAYRRLSDARLARSGGSLSTLGKPGSEHIRANSGEVLSPSGEVRLEKDYAEGDDEAAIETSEDDSEDSSGEEWDAGGRRGRMRTKKRQGLSPEGDESQDRSRSGKPANSLGMGMAPGPRKTLSLMAAAEQERQDVSSTYKVRSLLSPPLTVTNPEGDRIIAKKVGVHPSTSFDQGASTPMSSDTEADLTDIRRAQRLNISVSPISSTPESHRAIRTVIRGEFSKMQQEAEDGLRRQRTYLVATDLSDEAAHALEWTIGTILRDGDTMLAVYAVDSEAGTGAAGESGQGIAIGEGALAVNEQAAEVGSLTKKSLSAAATSTHSPLAQAAVTSGNSEHSVSPDTPHRTKQEQERDHACEDISQRCVRLMRKTRLQVRVVVEVIHCKSPKHLITEVIDFIEPTLVILGSRGRSALKGVLLGSFSNYLVSKSSVPVMVARRRLRKHSKYKRTNVRLSNNLTPTNRLTAAKID